MRNAVTVTFNQLLKVKNNVTVSIWGGGGGGGENKMT
jgi:hypothetical protein